MADQIVLGVRHNTQLFVIAKHLNDDGTLAAATITAALAAGKCQWAFYQPIVGHTAENPDGSGVDTADTLTDATYNANDDLNPETPPAG